MKRLSTIVVSLLLLLPVVASPTLGAAIAFSTDRVVAADTIKVAAKKPNLVALVKLVWKQSAPVRALWNAYQGYDLAGWEAGRLIAVREGLPDPGPKPNPTLLQKVIYAVAARLGHL